MSGFNSTHYRVFDYVNSLAGVMDRTGDCGVLRHEEQVILRKLIDGNHADPDCDHDWLEDKDYKDRICVKCRKVQLAQNR